MNHRASIEGVMPLPLRSPEVDKKVGVNWPMDNFMEGPVLFVSFCVLNWLDASACFLSPARGGFLSEQVEEVLWANAYSLEKLS